MRFITTLLHYCMYFYTGFPCWRSRKNFLPSTAVSFGPMNCALIIYQRSKKETSSTPLCRTSFPALFSCQCSRSTPFIPFFFELRPRPSSPYPPRRNTMPTLRVLAGPTPKTLTPITSLVNTNTPHRIVTDAWEVWEPLSTQEYPKFTCETI
jgi:hypothetical protein